MGRILDYLDSRFGFKRVHKNIFERPVPLWLNYSYCFGGIAFTLFILLFLTGLLLSIYYIPTEEEAYRSILRINNEIRFGKLIRGIHHWSAHLMVVMVILHMIRVYVTGSFKKPRELNWIAGLLLFTLTMAFGFTGYLLPWDQKAYWATVIGTNMAGTFPVIGDGLLYLLRGGPEVDGQTLLRFYSLHILWLPGITLFLLWAHFHMIRQQGISGGL